MSAPLYVQTRGRPVSRHWFAVSDPDLGAGWLASRHYSHPQRDESDALRVPILPPGEKLLLVTRWADAVAGFVRQRFRADGRAGVYLSIFRNESDALSSDLLRDAARAAGERWPGLPLFTFVDASAVRSTNPGYCFKAAGWRPAGATARGLLCFVFPAVC